jgi:hypothetical protein
MRRFLSVLAAAALASSASGCACTGHVADAAAKWRRPNNERLTATSSAKDPAGIPYGVVALEAECRITPEHPEGGAYAFGYTLLRAKGPEPDEQRFADGQKVDVIAVYHSGATPEHTSPFGFPESVLLGTGSDGEPALFLGTSGRWARVPVARFLHEEASRGHPVAATVFEVFVLPLALVTDLGTFPIQWMLESWLPLTPP